MNSLEFIKQHVTEWPDVNAIQVNLYNDGVAVFSNPVMPPPYHIIDLSEHFAPDYHDGKVWTREEFESVGCAPVEYRFNDVCANPLLKCEFGDYYYYLTDSDEWMKYTDMLPSHWSGAIKITDSMAANYIKCGELEASCVGTSEQVNEPSVDATVEERGSRYGAFKDGADIMQSLKTVMRDTPNWSSLTPSQREALEMIQHKIGRILNGDPNYTDSWHDIQGYARLVEEELNGNVK